MTVKELFDLFTDFKQNEFAHLERKVDRLLWFILATLGGIIATLIKVLIN